VIGVIAYISLVSVAGGREAPIELEDWSADKAGRIDSLLPHEACEVKRSMRLIDSGSDVEYVTVAARNSETPASSTVSRLQKIMAANIAER
jgi:hypothetical protein